MDVQIPAPANGEQISKYREVTARRWGGLQNQPEYERAFHDAVEGRYLGALAHLVPLARRHIPDAANRSVFEIGCGTGSSTAAFATLFSSIRAYDIAQADVEQAKDRLTAFQCSNASVTARAFPEIISDLERSQVGAVLLYAVLEHMHVSERLTTLRAAWKALEPGGYLIVCETPNRLSYFDTHTSHLPFMSMLPAELAHLWMSRSNQASTRMEIERDINAGTSIQEKMTRIGWSGPSFHEFEVAIPGIPGFVVSKPDDVEIEPWLTAYKLEFDILNAYFTEKQLSVNPVFALPILNFIARKS